MTLLARLEIDGRPSWVVPEDPTVKRFRRLPPDWGLLDLTPGSPVPAEDFTRELGASVLLPPLEVQPVWASGVTFSRSRDARVREAVTEDIYQRVYDADRPELFFKAGPGECRGPHDPITVRSDSRWNVPEPELGVVATAKGEILGYFLGNDMSSRDIEGENPLYLPQAKVWCGSCAIGPVIRVATADIDWRSWIITLRIRRGGRTVYEDQVSLAAMRRDPADLASWLVRGVRAPAGIALLTGTSIVPDDSVSVVEGDIVEIASPGLGSMSNPVVELAMEGSL